MTERATLAYPLLDMILLAAVFGALARRGVMARLLLTFRENVAMLRHSRSEALTDPLTGLGNRRTTTGSAIPPATRC